jgi:hypothetical protein
MKHYLFEDEVTGEEFLVGAFKSSQALAIAQEIVEAPRYIGKVSEYEAEASGLDEF